MSEETRRRSPRLGRVVDDPFSRDARYQVIYADPPWYYRDRATAGARGAAYKYPDLTDRQIAELPVADIAAENSILFLWVTWPKLPEVLPVIEAWGFRYRTVAFVWVKRSPKSGRLVWGMGSWTRANTEPCLLAIRGRPKRIDAGVHQVVEAPRGRHSHKPDEVRDRIVRLTGDVPRIELFAREAAPGWHAWGNEAAAGPGTALAGRRARPVVAPIQSEAFEPAEPEPAVLDHVSLHHRITRADVARLLGIEPQEATALLRRMVSRGSLVLHRHGRASWYAPVEPVPSRGGESA